MKNQIITFDEKAAYDLASEYFTRISGLDLKKASHKKMKIISTDARNSGIGGIDIRAIISSYGPEVYQNNRINIDGVQLNCNAFSLIENRDLVRIYIYAITVGGCSYKDNDNIMTKIFADIWGTSYTDAGRIMLEKYIKEDIDQLYPGQLGKEIFLTDSFGPGFYGMPVEHLREIASILDVKSINLEVNKNGIMVPIKSCSGVYFVVKDSNCMPHASCVDCLGNVSNCQFCKLRYSRNNNNI